MYSRVLLDPRRRTETDRDGKVDDAAAELPTSNVQCHSALALRTYVQQAASLGSLVSCRVPC